MTASNRSVSTNRAMRSIGPPAIPRCSMMPSSLRRSSTSTGPPGAIMYSKGSLQGSSRYSGSCKYTSWRRSSPKRRRLRSTERRICSPEKSPVWRSRSAFVASTTPSGRPPISSSTSPMRRSLSPSPYDAAVSRKLIGLSKTVLSVSRARSSSTEKSKVSGMSPSGAHPRHNGEMERPVPPRVLLDEGSTTLFSTIPPVRALRALCCPRRCGLCILQSLLHALVTQKCLPVTFPDDVFDRRIVRVLGRDERSLLRPLQQSPTPIGEQIGLGTDVEEYPPWPRAPATRARSGSEGAGSRSPACAAQEELHVPRLRGTL